MYFTSKKKLNPRPCVAVGFPECVELVRECDRCLAQAHQVFRQSREGGVHEEAELGEFHERYQAAIQVLGGTIVGVEHYPYRERYRGRSPQGGIAVIDFPFNGRMQFRRRPEIQAETTDRAFALAIIREVER